MLFAIILVSLVFLGVGLTVTESNAKYLLSGYNTMPEAERRKIDIAPYIKFFRNFHLFLSVSLLAGGLLLYYFINKDWSGIFLGAYPILAYLVFVWLSRRFSANIPQREKSKSGIVAGLLLVVLLLVIFMFVSSLRENQIEVAEDNINITGEYGGKLKFTEIKSIELVEDLPAIVRKTNGFALETIRKGYFKTGTGEEVKLIINSAQKPLILITTTENEQIYFSAKTENNRNLFKKLQETRRTQR